MSVSFSTTGKRTGDFIKTDARTVASMAPLPPPRDGEKPFDTRVTMGGASVLHEQMEAHAEHMKLAMQVRRQTDTRQATTKKNAAKERK